ncbi:Predicted ATPase [Haloechinothrix alba]|uniref:Predicted ATPase n=1 Tax=Haloechinothrix alba TaxID=664784 RepID=A0A238Y4C2_9PSEU|nr:LuxR C-terminal-related transcriptional regulator [Haloechinothrix alba]SNR66116.1 Predicted ATPase [Haloechinothrix alba]
MTEKPPQPPSRTLPVEVTRFVGRRRELNEAKRLFALTHLVTLTGVGGSGKTRMAARLARELERAFPDGICFVRLAELQDSSLLGHTVADALGLREVSRQWRIETLTEYLATRKLLLVLDNCEHVLDACATLADELLQTAPDLRILATSREPLGIAGESTLSVPPLTVPDTACSSAASLVQYDSVNLFLDRANSAVPGFQLTEANRTAVATLCHALDGLPLALELAAIRLRALSLDQIVERITDRYNLLTSGSRNAPDRQKTLWALITWSFELCSPKEQALWCRLTVFSGGIELDAAEEVCSDGHIPSSEIFDVLASLVDKSILIREDHGARVRYQLLETIRQYGQQRLHGSGELAWWRRRHRDFYADLVARTFAEWIGPEQAQRLDRLRRDHTNIRAALEYCVSEPGEEDAALRLASDLYFYWLTRGFISEGRHWLDLVLARTTNDGELKAHAHCVDANLATLQDDPETAGEQLAEANTIAERLGDRRCMAYVAQSRALAAMYADELPEAIAVFEYALEICDQVGDHIGAAFTLFLHSLAAVLHGDPVKANESHRRCQALTEPAGELWIRSYSLWAASLNAWRQGDIDLALRRAFDGLDIKWAIDDQLGIAECFEAIAWIEATRHRCERAATVLGAADTIWRAMGMSLSAIPGLHRYRAESLARARRLGERPFTSAFRAGTRMSIDEAVRFTLEKTDVEAPAREHDTASAQLTRRESEIAGLVAEGLSNREIATRLVISRRTVEAHVEHVLAKLGFTSRAQIAAWVTERDTRTEAV